MKYIWILESTEGHQWFFSSRDKAASAAEVMWEGPGAWRWNDLDAVWAYHLGAFDGTLTWASKATVAATLREAVINPGE